MKTKKAVISFSGGKDCTLAMYRMMKKGYEIAALLVTFDNEEESCFHRIPKDILYEISESCGIPLVEVNCIQGRDYGKEFEKVLRELKGTGIDVCVFGDIDIDDHKKWGEDRCIEAGMESSFPLWQEDREKLTNEFLESGFTAVIKKVNLDFLGDEFLGEKLSRELIEKIKNKGADPCGENGEYHTVVIDGPIFKNKIEMHQTGREILGQYGYLKIKNNTNSEVN